MNKFKENIYNLLKSVRVINSKVTKCCNDIVVLFKRVSALEES